MGCFKDKGTIAVCGGSYVKRMVSTAATMGSAAFRAGRSRIFSLRPAADASHLGDEWPKLARFLNRDLGNVVYPCILSGYSRKASLRGSLQQNQRAVCTIWFCQVSTQRSSLLIRLEPGSVEGDAQTEARARA